jgi:hypothetical protein
MDFRFVAKNYASTRIASGRCKRQPLKAGLFYCLARLVPIRLKIIFSTKANTVHGHIEKSLSTFPQSGVGLSRGSLDDDENRQD